MTSEPGMGTLDLTVCDREPIRVPGTIQPHGRAVLEFIRGKDRLAGLPVVVLSGSADHAGIEDVYRLGARGYVVKPFEGKLLAQAMATVVEYWRTVALPHLTTRKDHDDWLGG